MFTDKNSIGSSGDLGVIKANLLLPTKKNSTQRNQVNFQNKIGLTNGMMSGSTHCFSEQLQLVVSVV